MEKIVRQSLLYDFYGELLTDHQKNIYEKVIDDMSYAEIASEEEISRQAVYDLVKRINHILEDYETKLQLVDKFLNARKRMEKLSATIEEMKVEKISKELEDKLDTVLKESREIFEEF